MIRLEDIAKLAGVSRTTVSNVIHGNTKRVSLETVDRIKKIIEEQGYVPNMASQILSGNGSKIIGVVLGYGEAHGIQSMQDPFVGEFLGAIKSEAEKYGYFIMLIGGEDYQKVVESASQWNVEGLIILGYSEQMYKKLCKKLNRKIVLVDTYPESSYTFYNVGVDDYSGGQQIGRYLCSNGFFKALFVAETEEGGDLRRWYGFKNAMEEDGKFCSKVRYLIAPSKKELRLRKYKEWIPKFLEAGAVAFASDFAAIEAINFFQDEGIKVPEQISVTGFDDNMYAVMVRPQLTTVHQDIKAKARIAMDNLMMLIRGEYPQERNVKSPVRLVIRDSVLEK